MTWDLAFARDPGRVARLTELGRAGLPRYDGTCPDAPGQVPARVLPASAQFTGPPGREREAAEAWAFEMKAYFTRGVGEQPAVTYEGGTYTVTGLITTTHPGDRPGPDGIVRFT